jgi:hypothetical protein
VKKIFEDTKGVIRSSKSKKERQYYGKKKKEKKYLQNKTKKKKKSLEIPKRQLETVNRIRADNTMAKRKRDTKMYFHSTTQPIWHRYSETVYQ